MSKPRRKSPIVHWVRPFHRKDGVLVEGFVRGSRPIPNKTDPHYPRRRYKATEEGLLVKQVQTKRDVIGDFRWLAKDYPFSELKGIWLVTGEVPTLFDLVGVRKTTSVTVVVDGRFFTEKATIHKGKDGNWYIETDDFERLF